MNISLTYLHGLEVAELIEEDIPMIKNLLILKKKYYGNIK